MVEVDFMQVEATGDGARRRNDAFFRKKKSLTVVLFTSEKDEEMREGKGMPSLS